MRQTLELHLVARGNSDLIILLVIIKVLGCSFGLAVDLVWIIII